MLLSLRYTLVETSPQAAEATIIIITDSNSPIAFIANFSEKSSYEIVKYQSINPLNPKNSASLPRTINLSKFSDVIKFCHSSQERIHPRMG
jgi:hypothetical protein